MTNLAVLVSSTKHPISGVPRHHHNDSLALQLGLNLAKKHSASLLVLHAGDANNPALQDYLALGAGQIDVISATDNLVENLAELLKNTDLILTGTRAENAMDSGLLPYLLAAKLNLPVVAGALEISLHEDKSHEDTLHKNHAGKNKLEVLQFLPKGQRRRIVVALPAVIAVHPLAPVALRFVHAQRGIGRINILANTLNDISASTITKWISEPARKPIKLKAQTKQTGHERLMEAISNKVKGGTVVNDGNNVEKAQVILRYLREHQLTKF